MSKKLKLQEMAERLSISARTLNKYIDVYDLPFILIGRHKRFDPEKVERALEHARLHLPDLKPGKRKIEISSNPNRDFFRRELGLR